MYFNENLDFNEFIGSHTILYGETNTKKTYYTAKFVQFLVEAKGIDPKEISILDFAPKLCVFKNVKIGGKIIDFYPQCFKCNNISFEGEIIPPRLTAKNKKELYKYAFENYEKTRDTLNKFNEAPTQFLIINDISIFLHCGDKKFLLKSLNAVNTFFGNSYYGSSIKRNFTIFFSLKEKFAVSYLLKRVDKSYFTK